MDWIRLFVQSWLKLLYKEHFINQTVEFTLALSQDLKIRIYVTWDCSMLLFKVILWFPIEKDPLCSSTRCQRCLDVYPTWFATQTTLLVANNMLLVNDRHFFSFGLILCLIFQLVYPGQISIPILHPSSPSCLRAELADLWSLNNNTILTGASFTLLALVEIGSPETFLVTKWKIVDCISWAGYWCQENICVRRSHSRWNSCQVDDSLKARSSIPFSNDFLYLTSTRLL